MITDASWADSPSITDRRLQKPVCLVCGRPYDQPYVLFSGDLTRVTAQCAAQVHDNQELPSPLQKAFRAKAIESFAAHPGLKRCTGAPVTKEEWDRGIRP